MAESGLAAVEPDASIRFSRAVGYRQLLETIRGAGGVEGNGLGGGGRDPLA